MRTKARELEFAIEHASARENGSPADAADLLAGKHSEDFFDFEDGEIDFTGRLIREAHDLRVPIPERPPHSLSFADQKGNQWWEHSSQLGELYLSTLGIAALRKAVREEREARHTARNHWIGWIGALTGLVGTITALVAIFGSSR